MNLPLRTVFAGAALGVLLIGATTAVVLRNEPAPSAIITSLGENAFGRISELSSVGLDSGAAAEATSERLAAPSEGATDAAYSTTEPASFISYLFEYQVSEDAIPQDLPATISVYKQGVDAAISALTPPESSVLAGDTKVTGLELRDSDYSVTYSSDGFKTIGSVKEDEDLYSAAYSEAPKVTRQQLFAAVQPMIDRLNLSDAYGPFELGSGGDYFATLQRPSDTDAGSTVFAPFRLNNIPVFTEYGQDGVVITANFKVTKAQYVGGLRSNVFSSSTYPLSASREELEARLQKTVGYGYARPMTVVGAESSVNPEVVSDLTTVEGTEPTKVTRKLLNGTRVYLRKDTANGETLYVPALRFTVEGAAEGEQQHVTVPLVD